MSWIDSVEEFGFCRACAKCSHSARLFSDGEETPMLCLLGYDGEGELYFCYPDGNDCCPYLAANGGKMNDCLDCKTTFDKVEQPLPCQSHDKNSFR